MKIKWIDGQRDVVGVGMLNTGDVRDIPGDIAERLIKQGQAKKVKPKKSED